VPVERNNDHERLERVEAMLKRLNAKTDALLKQLRQATDKPARLKAGKKR
jgi:hypothetical protein